ncbi:flagellar protein FlaG [Castellaniella sp.]|uniref:flagellar protein FlaG n=1 Tax=Castellaniella sp. TaxID=1955812 RepID=UPI002AFDCE43|nr:flagellar protein FlaG [Castellaniella sp.]
MIHPIGNQLTSASLGLTPAVSERPAGKPEPVAEVSAGEKAQSGTSKQAGQQNPMLKEYPEQPKSSLEKALESINGNLQAWSTGVRFDMDKDTQKLVISIVDSASGDVIKTIPSEAMLRIAKMIAQLQGSGVDTKA